jgi:nucleoside diphosphate kinase
LYVIAVGLDHLKARKRAVRRRELRRAVRPKFRAGRVTGSIELTAQSKKRLLQKTQELFGDDGWKIGAISLGNFTKEALLSEAANERVSAKGHVRTAEFYEALAEPMQSGQLVRDYWRQESAVEVRDKIWKNSESRKAELV